MIYNQSSFHWFGRKHLLIGQFGFSVFFKGHHLGSIFTGTDVITASDQTLQVVHSSKTGLNLRFFFQSRCSFSPIFISFLSIFFMLTLKLCVRFSQELLKLKY